VTDVDISGTTHNKGGSTMTRLWNFVREDDGQDLIEYALLAGFISLVAVLAIENVGTGVNSVYEDINTSVANITPIP